MSGGTVVSVSGESRRRRCNGGDVVVAGQQRDVLFADRALAVHFGVEIRRNLEIRLQ